MCYVMLNVNNGYVIRNATAQMKTSIDPLPKLEVVVKTKSDTFHDPLTNEMAG